MTSTVLESTTDAPADIEQSPAETGIPPANKSG